MPPLRTAALLAVAVASFAAAPVSALEPWAEAAIKGWSEDLQPAESYKLYKFTDEDGLQRTLYCKASPDKWNSYLAKDSCQLYMFPVAPAPAREVREMTQPASCNDVAGKTIKVDIVTIKGAQVSPYYVATVDSFRTMIGRHDRPETRLLSPWSAEDYYTSFFPWPPSGYTPTAAKPRPVLSCNGVVPWGRIQVYKPDGVATAAASPMTTLDAENLCASVDSGPAEVSYRGWLPQEFELWHGAQDPSVATPGIWQTAQWKANEAGFKSGQTANGAPFFAWYRLAAKPGIESFGAATADASAPKDRFTPRESRFLQCRANHVKQQGPFFLKIQALNASKAQTATFVSFWRQYIQRELAQYLKDAAAVEPLPRFPDFAGVDKGIHDRFAEAMQGKLAGVNTKAANPAPTTSTAGNNTPAPAKKKKLTLPDPSEAFQ